jgi:hypothetical protein
MHLITRERRSPARSQNVRLRHDQPAGCFGGPSEKAGGGRITRMNRNTDWFCRKCMTSWLSVNLC